MKASIRVYVSENSQLEIICKQKIIKMQSSSNSIWLLGGYSVYQSLESMYFLTNILTFQPTKGLIPEIVKFSRPFFRKNTFTNGSRHHQYTIIVHKSCFFIKESPSNECRTAGSDIIKASFG